SSEILMLLLYPRLERKRQRGFDGINAQGLRGMARSPALHLISGGGEQLRSPITVDLQVSYARKTRSGSEIGGKLDRGSKQRFIIVNQGVQQRRRRQHLCANRLTPDNHVQRSLQPHQARETLRSARTGQ